jgi:hypothetical protein
LPFLIALSFLTWVNILLCLYIFIHINYFLKSLVLLLLVFYTIERILWHLKSVAT